MSNVQTIPSTTLGSNVVAVDLNCNMNEFSLNLFQSKTEEDQRETYLQLTAYMNTLMTKLQACDNLRLQYLACMNTEQVPYDFDDEHVPPVHTQRVVSSGVQ